MNGAWWPRAHPRTRSGTQTIGPRAAGRTRKKKDRPLIITLPDGKAAFPVVSTPNPIRARSDLFLDDTRIATLHENGVVRV